MDLELYFTRCLDQPAVSRRLRQHGRSTILALGLCHDADEPWRYEAALAEIPDHSTARGLRGDASAHSGRAVLGRLPEVEACGM